MNRFSHVLKVTAIACALAFTTVGVSGALRGKARLLPYSRGADL